MDYEKKYKEALEKLQKALTPTEDGCKISGLTRYCIENIFPELRESEDERIRKALIRFHKSTIDIDGIKGEDILTWLEKQKEFVSADFDDVWKTADCDELTAPLEKYSKDAIKKMCHAWYDKGIELERKSCLKKQGEQILANSAKTGKDEQNTADKVGPNFHKGQWIVWQDKYYKVNYNGCGYELVDQNGLSTSLEYGTIDENAHLWNITDANPGDVLVASDGSIFLFGGVDDSACKYYAALTADNYIKINKEAKGGYWETSRAVYPATKEQRDQLEKAMADAGYTFDFDKKELKKVEQKSTDNEMIEILRTEYEKGRADAIAEMQNTAWSEEDEMFVHGLIRGLSARRDIHGHTTFSSDCIDITETINWLKSLKDRYAWKPSDEQMQVLLSEVTAWTKGCIKQMVLESLYNDLKKLKG